MLESSIRSGKLVNRYPFVSLNLRPLTWHWSAWSFLNILRDVRLKIFEEYPLDGCLGAQEWTERQKIVEKILRAQRDEKMVSLLSDAKTFCKMELIAIGLCGRIDAKYSPQVHHLRCVFPGNVSKGLSRGMLEGRMMSNHCLCSNSIVAIWSLIGYN